MFHAPRNHCAKSRFIFNWHAIFFREKVDRTRKTLTLSFVIIINPMFTPTSTAAAEFANLSPAEHAELQAWFAWVDDLNEEVDLAWDRLAALVDSGAL